MSLRTDRVLSRAFWHARHRLLVTAIGGDKNESTRAFDAYAAQFDAQTRRQMTTVYLQTLAGVLVEDRRIRGRQLW